MPLKLNPITGKLDLVEDLGANLEEIQDVTGNKGDILVHDGTDWVDLAVGTNDHVLTADSAQSKGVKWAAVAAGMPNFTFGGQAAGFQVNTTTDFPPPVYRDFGSVEMLCRGFDTTGPEYVQGSFRVPADLDTAGTVTFEIIGSAATAAASKNVKFTFDFLQVADDGLMTGSYGGALTWDDQSISATQDDMDIISNTETVSNLGWVAGRMVYWRLYRGAATTNNLASDYDVISFIGQVPQA